MSKQAKALVVGLVLALFALAGALGYFATHPTVRIEKVVVTTTVPADLSLPPGVSYAELQKSLLATFKQWWVENEQGQSVADPFVTTSIECELPKVWQAGAQFNCPTFEAEQQNGTLAVTVETTDPGQPFSYVLDWSDQSS